MAPQSALISPVASALLDRDFDAHKLTRDHKRQVDHKRKWALGEAPTTSGIKIIRPEKYSSLFNMPVPGARPPTRAANMAKVCRKHGNPHLDPDSNSSDSSNGEEDGVREASAGPEIDADITYSFDAQHGPEQGGRVLSLAINKAVERFETRRTEELVKHEYDVVSEKDSEADFDCHMTDVDDFELL